MYYYKCGYLEDKKKWLGCILLNDATLGLTKVVTVGVKETEEEIIKWCEGSVESMNAGGEELPD